LAITGRFKEEEKGEEVKKRMKEKILITGIYASTVILTFWILALIPK